MCVIAISLQSGSSGNCIYVETDGVKLLFDAGISGIKAKERLALHDRDINDVDALIISHDHADHVRYAGVYQRKFGIPLYITRRTFTHSLKKHELGRINEVHFFMAGETIEFQSVTVQTVPCPHDAADGAVFVISSGSKRLGIMTDLGHTFNDLCSIIPSLDAVFIESNYDHDMLFNGPFPAFLKQRISGPKGHISNREAAGLLLGGQRLKWACLAHLSQNNNDPSLALRTHREIIGDSLTLYTAGRYDSTDMFQI